MELGVADPVPPLDAATVSHQLQQTFWACAEAGEKEVFGVEALAVAGSCGGGLNDPACAEPGLTDVLGRFFRLQRPGDVKAITALMIHCKKRDLAFPLVLTFEVGDRRSASLAAVGPDGSQAENPCWLEGCSGLRLGATSPAPRHEDQPAVLS